MVEAEIQQATLEKAEEEGRRFYGISFFQLVPHETYLADLKKEPDYQAMSPSDLLEEIVKEAVKAGEMKATATQDELATQSTLLAELCKLLDHEVSSMESTLEEVQAAIRGYDDGYDGFGLD